NSVNYTYRMHDPRLGRFFAVDPLADKYYSQTISDFGNASFGSKDQIALGVSFFTPLKLNFKAQLTFDVLTPQVEFTSKGGFDGFWNRSPQLNVLNGLRGAINTGL